MRLSLPSRLLSGLLAASFALVLYLAGGLQERMAVSSLGGDRLYAQGAADGEQGQSRTYQRLRRADGQCMADYGFTNFNREFLTVHFEVPSATYDNYEAAWGYREKDLAALKTWHEQARKDAYEKATARQESQAQFDADIDALAALYDKKVKDYLASKSFQLLPDNVVMVDVPKVVRESAPLVKSVAGAFDRMAVERHYDSANIIGAMSALVQTAVLYREVPPVVDGTHTGGVWPPVKTLIGGRGDCDTKTALLASLLANWPQMRMVGVALPDHYLMGILRIPNKGDLYVEHQGIDYVLVEPAGPAWLAPGSVGERTRNLLEASQGFKIEPFF